MVTDNGSEVKGAFADYFATQCSSGPDITLQQTGEWSCGEGHFILREAIMKSVKTGKNGLPRFI